jgi:predicted regulator of Ras-like GTPase activity (Roadblock/LC7/MglB family)
MSDFLQNFQNDLKENINGFIAVSVTEIQTGMSYCSLSLDPNFDPELASAYNLEVVKAKQNAIKALGLDQKINDILITLSDQLHIIDVSEDGNYFIYLAVDATKANLGLTRATLSKFKKDIISKL